MSPDIHLRRFGSFTQEDDDGGRCPENVHQYIGQWVERSSDAKTSEFKVNIIINDVACSSIDKFGRRPMGSIPTSL